VSIDATEERSTTRPTACACTNNTGTKVFVSRGDARVTVYEIDGKHYSKKETLNVTKTIRENGNNTFTTLLAANDFMTELRLIGDGETHLRLAITKGKEFFFIDIQMSDGTPVLRPTTQFEDKSVFQLKDDKTEVKLMQANLRTCIK